ncbi:hypothetical protein Lser_V15G28078 [Lactuca serriola]
MAAMMKLGPREMQGSLWDDRGKSKIDQIFISFDNYVVYSIQFVYVVDGKLVPSEVHGTPCGSKFDIVKFDQPREYLTSVTGRLARYRNDRLLSITFGTNKRNDYNSCIHGIGIYVKASGSVAETEQKPTTIINIEDDD